MYTFATDDPTPTWTNVISSVALGNIEGALSYFSMATVDKYRQAFLSVGTANTIAAMNDIGALIPVYIGGSRAEYYFNSIIDGQTITFPVDFIKENGQWKILEF